MSLKTQIDWILKILTHNFIKLTVFLNKARLYFRLESFLLTFNMSSPDPSISGTTYYSFTLYTVNTKFVKLVLAMNSVLSSGCKSTLWLNYR